LSWQTALSCQIRRRLKCWSWRSSLTRLRRQLLRFQLPLLLISILLTFKSRWLRSDLSLRPHLLQSKRPSLNSLLFCLHKITTSSRTSFFSKSMMRLRQEFNLSKIKCSSNDLISCFKC
jgi:hypothetical protein